MIEKKLMRLLFVIVFVLITSIEAQAQEWCSDSCEAQVFPYAVLSQGAYSGNDLTSWRGWERIGVEEIIIQGYRASIFKNTLREEVVVAFEGTDPSNIFDLYQDVSTDFLQLLGFNIPRQYFSALYTTYQVLSDINSIDSTSVFFDNTITGYSLSLTGHSLGGGLASFAGYVFRHNAITFNPAPLLIQELELADYYSNLEAQIPHMLGNGITLNIVTTNGTVKDLVASSPGALLGDIKYIDVQSEFISDNAFSLTELNGLKVAMSNFLNVPAWITQIGTEILSLTFSLHSIDTIVDYLENFPASASFLVSKSVDDYNFELGWIDIPDAVSYELHYGVEEGVYIGNVVINSSSLSVQNGPKGIYYITVFAYDMYGRVISISDELSLKLTPIISVTETTLDFGNSTTQLTFDILNLGDSDLNWIIEEDEIWLGASSNSGDTSVDGNYSGTGNDTFTVTVGRNGLSDGLYESILTISSNDGTVEIAVNMRVTESTSDIDSSLIAYYPLDGDALDESGNNNHGTIHGDSFFTAGWKSDAISFNNKSHAGCCNNDAYMTLPDFSMTEFTVSLMVKFNFNAHAGCHSASIISFGAYASSNGFFSLDVVGCESEGLIQTSSGSTGLLGDNDWHHLAASVKGTRMNVYVDGILVNTLTLPEPLVLTNATGYLSRHLWSGGSSSSSRFNGSVDEVKIYNRELSSSQIGTLSQP